MPRANRPFPALALALLCSALAGCAHERSPANEPRLGRTKRAEPAGHPTKPQVSEAASVGASPAPETTVAPAPDDAELRTRFRGHAPRTVLRGEASYYGDSLAGHHTANGERYDPKAFTAAHRSLPFGTIVRVVRTDTGAETYVRVTDRGPFGSSRRILDLSRAAAERLGMIRRGVVAVRADVLEYGASRKR